MEEAELNPEHFVEEPLNSTCVETDNKGVQTYPEEIRQRVLAEKEAYFSPEHSSSRDLRTTTSIHHQAVAKLSTSVIDSFAFAFPPLAHREGFNEGYRYSSTQGCGGELGESEEEADMIDIDIKRLFLLFSYATDQSLLLTLKTKGHASARMCLSSTTPASQPHPQLDKGNAWEMRLSPKLIVCNSPVGNSYDEGDDSRSPSYGTICNVSYHNRQFVLAKH
ncbi:uncharacterized protein LACBIDRAFT_335777 [Laccaria bicolor S238N-H82]|uniref:Predicted protein n=1 Tax=Laccaria bicolor (strain S238N-H82 / ATCC MYA-4686) TaxID=486041 RepID=B0E3D4_LACBS|nr:uncharacterized protein LACBIDRAFT_335777 [Laccaria bicolor S238N-H82]EDQ98644.1 predicted protein [Laccaria bicolor S238N-H82]|eukprot:XP_001890710.1 predicted protein [Laccaria bicolor S238N-H82]